MSDILKKKECVLYGVVGWFTTINNGWLSAGNWFVVNNLIGDWLHHSSWFFALSIVRPFNGGQGQETCLKRKGTGFTNCDENKTFWPRISLKI